MKDYRDLKVWEKAPALALEIYRVTARFPREELYGLTSQMRDAARQLAQTLPRAVANAAMPNSSGSCKLPQVLPASWTTTCCLRVT